MCILARSTVLLEHCLCLSLIPAWAVPLGHCIQVKVFPVTTSTSPFWELQEPFGEVILWFVMELGAWCFPSTQSYWDLPGDICLGCPKCQSRGSYRWIYSYGTRVEKVAEHKSGRHLNNLFLEWSLFNGLACLCVCSGNKLGCNEADVVKGCVGTSDSCSSWTAATSALLLWAQGSEHRSQHSSKDGMSPGCESGGCRREDSLCSGTLFPRRKAGQLGGVVLHERVKQWSSSLENKEMESGGVTETPLPPELLCAWWCLLPSCAALAASSWPSHQEDFCHPASQSLARKKAFLVMISPPCTWHRETDLPPCVCYPGLGCRLDIHIWAIAIAADSHHVSWFSHFSTELARYYSFYLRCLLKV